MAIKPWEPILPDWAAGGAAQTKARWYGAQRGERMSGEGGRVSELQYLNFKQKSKLFL